ncbi:uncharacterized protein LOC120350428 isoform X2 [Nilaparvata lugens]|uniref:uncharacterized protein LOC120350428 isoform X2 n=1 Tax=Nilaparvata lugens TaxID=108931 RepID=UPI00193C9B75|nr:uncharacterized protein LOC120350428 isoform X2 [Nilaparvata lugens]
MEAPEVIVQQGENVVRIVEGTTRKRKRNVKNWQKTKDKEKRHAAHGFPTLPNCGHGIREGNKSDFKCPKINMQDIRRFLQNFYKTTNKIEQDHFVIRYAKGKAPK